MLQLPLARLGIQALDVALFALGHRRIHEHLDKLAGREQVARHAPLGPEGRDEAHQRDQPGIHHQPRHLGDAPDVLDPIRLGEAQIAIQAVAHIVAIEQISVPALGMQAHLQQVRQCRLAGPGKTREPDALRTLLLARGPAGLVQGQRLPVEMAHVNGRFRHRWLPTAATCPHGTARQRASLASVTSRKIRPIPPAHGPGSPASRHNAPAGTENCPRSTA